MRVSKINPSFGINIYDVDLKNIDEEQLSELKKLLAIHGLIVFKNQLLEDKDIFEFSKIIGTGQLEFSARTICHSGTFPEISYLTNLKSPEGEPLGFPGLGTDFWHSDQEFKQHPATLASLYCLVAPVNGGMTSFAYCGAENIVSDEQLLTKLRTMRSTRVPAKTHDNVEHIEISHPVILKNPVTGKEFIYVSENTLRYPDLELAESAELKSSLLNSILIAANIYTHKWSLGDFIFYDNSQLIHRREHCDKGIRWLKASKIFAQKEYFAVPDGIIIGTADSVRHLEQKNINLSIS